METNIRQLRCGECGEAKHELYIRPNGEIIAECTNCGSQSEIVITTPKISIRNNKGNGTLCAFANNNVVSKKAKKAKSPREEVMERISQIIVDKLGVEEIEVREKARFTDDLGADSLDAVELMMEFEREFNVAIPDDDAENVLTVGEAVDLVYKLCYKS